MWTIERVRECASTQDLAKGKAAGTVVIAKAQSAGRGRKARAFVCPKGGLYLTAVVALPVVNARLPLVAAVALYDAARQLGERLSFKWPNDLLKDGRKVAGILVDVDGDRARLGLGVNVGRVPPEVADIAAALDVDRDALERGLLDQLRVHLPALDDDALFSGCLEVLRNESAILGTLVRVDDAHGRAVDIDDDGALILQTERGRVRVLSGDVR